MQEQILVDRQDSIRAAQKLERLRLENKQPSEVFTISQKLISIGSTLENKEFIEKMDHTLPKMFFFMIPIVAFFMKILFIRRKNYLFVDHAIFSLHAHALFFSLFFITIINPFTKIESGLNWILVIIYIAYLIKAIKTVYKIGTGKSIFKMALLSIGYCMTFALVAVATIIGMIYMNH